MQTTFPDRIFPCLAEEISQNTKTAKFLDSYESIQIPISEGATQSHYFRDLHMKFQSHNAMERKKENKVL